MFPLKFLRLFSFPFSIVTTHPSNYSAGVLELNVLTATVEDLSFLLQSNHVSSVELTRLYLSQIANHTDLNAVIEIAPRRILEDIAAELDYERRLGRSRGPLHGIPVLVKDNMATVVELGMNTTAGSFALLGSMVPDDADVVRKLRKAGAIILGKANMSVWANFRDISSTDGWSPRGGQTESFVAPGTNPGGSSSGSAVGLSAGFAPLTFGTETHGSLIFPASRAGVYALKPSWSSVKNDGIIPVSRSMDTPGVMAKHMWDLTVGLEAIMADASGKSQRKVLDAFDEGIESGWRGLRIGVLGGGEGEEIYNVAMQAMEKIQAAGAIVKWGLTAPALEEGNLTTIYADMLTVTVTEFKENINDYLARLKNSTIRTLEDLVEYDKFHQAIEMPPTHCCQEIFEQALLTNGTGNPEYKAAKQSSDMLSREFGIDYMLREYDVDVLVLSEAEGEGSDPWLLASVAGYPLATAPLARMEDTGMPYGIVFMAGDGGEAALIRSLVAWEMMAGMKG
ncbi:hypothetical protein RUND412_002852 [Rhizina undulata]